MKVEEFKTNTSRAQQQLIIENPREDSKELENQLQRLRTLDAENAAISGQNTILLKRIIKLEDETRCMWEYCMNILTTLFPILRGRVY